MIFSKRKVLQCGYILILYSRNLSISSNYINCLKKKSPSNPYSHYVFALIYTTIPANFFKSIFVVCHRPKFPTYEEHGGLTKNLFSTVKYATEILDFYSPSQWCSTVASHTWWVSCLGNCFTEKDIKLVENNSSFIIYSLCDILWWSNSFTWILFETGCICSCFSVYLIQEILRIEMAIPFLQRKVYQPADYLCPRSSSIFLVNDNKICF